MGGRSAGSIALGLLLCLDTASALRTEASDWRRHATRRRDGANSSTSVAVLIVGHIARRKSQHIFSFSAGGGNIVDLMTGGDDDDDEEEEEDLETSKLVKRRRASPWLAFKEHVLEPFASEGVEVDVFVCTDTLRGTVPPEVKHVYGFHARDQFERASLCYQRVLASRTYDIYIKSRPDFLLLKDFPDVAPMRRDRIHTRFRLAIGMPGLLSTHFSWDACRPSCNGLPASAVGYINDDMIWVVPSPIADRVFVSSSDFEYWCGRFVPPPNWLEPPTYWPETLFTKQLLAAGVQTEPLAVVGYPVLSRYNHSKDALPCANQPVAKVSCGDQASQHER